MCRFALKNRAGTWMENPQENLLLRRDFASLPVASTGFDPAAPKKTKNNPKIKPFINKGFLRSPLL
jgi:hypothetical protein